MTLDQFATVLTNNHRIHSFTQALGRTKVKGFYKKKRRNQNHHNNSYLTGLSCVLPTKVTLKNEGHSFIKLLSHHRNSSLCHKNLSNVLINMNKK